MEDEVERREFVRSAVATAGMTAGLAASMGGGEGEAQEKAAGQVGSTDKAGLREFYQLRTYTLRNGPQAAMLQDYFAHALVPGLNRMGMTPVGTFKLDVGPETPKYLVLIPASSAEALATVDARLAEDAEFVKAAAAFWSAPATAPAFVRAEYALLAAFAGWPRLTAPKSQKRIFQLRTYESASHAAHAQKVRMFNESEIAIFTRTGLTPVFFGETLVGGRMPSLTYMLTFADVAELTAHWATFGADPAWKELSRRPGNTDPEIVSNISNLYLSPLASSQI